MTNQALPATDDDDQGLRIARRVYEEATRWVAETRLAEAVAERRVVEAMARHASAEARRKQAQERELEARKDLANRLSGMEAKEA